MAKKKLKGGTGEQGELIDTAPDNVKPMIKKAKKYRAVIAERLEIQQKESELKAELREIVAASGLTPTDSGSIVFTYEDVTITVAPMQEGKLTVVVKDDE